MKAAVWHGRKDIRIEDLPEPNPAPGEIKIKVKWCGICGTDIHEYLAGPVLIKNPPVTLGHEYSGEVVGLGEGVEGFKPGDRVTGLNVRSCGRCGEACKVKNSMVMGKKMELCSNQDSTGLSTPGAFAEYLCLPAYLAVKMSAGLSWEEGAMINPLSIGIHAAKRAELRVGECVAVIGDGTIGQLTLQTCLAAGAREAFLIGEQPLRLEIAQKCGVGQVFDHRTAGLKSLISGRLEGRLPEVTFDCVGSEPAARMALDLAARGGRVTLVGIYEEPCRLDLKDVVVQEKNIGGVLSQDFEDYAIADALIARKQVVTEPLITSKIELADLVAGGIEELISNRAGQLRILVHP